MVCCLLKGLLAIHSAFWLPQATQLSAATGEFQQSLAAQTLHTSATEQDWISQMIDSSHRVSNITWFGDINEGLYFS